MALAALLVLPSAAPAQDAESASDAQQTTAIEGALKDLFADPGPQPGPDLFGYDAASIGATPMEDAWRGAASGGELSGPWADLVGRIGGLPAWTQAEAVNAFVNRRIAVADDPAVYGVADHWASLSETIAEGRGDCEDFAIAKMQLLIDAGVSPRDLYLVLVRDTVREADHAVLAVRDGERLWILDSANERMLGAEQVTRYRPIVGFSGDARWTFGHRTTQVAAAPIAVQPAAEPSEPAASSEPPFH